MKVYVREVNILSPLGQDAKENFAHIVSGLSGVMKYNNSEIDKGIITASLLPQSRYDEMDHQVDFTPFEQLLATSLKLLFNQSIIQPDSSDILFIFATTKGNISLLKNEDLDKDDFTSLSLAHSAQKVSRYFGNPNKPEVISNACISGVAALIYGRRMIDSGQYKHVVIAGADIVSQFIYSGFQSFQALSTTVCKPFSAERDGINLGEAAASIILSATKPPENAPVIEILQGAVTNDANHISGPSRSGQELAKAIQLAMKRSASIPDDIAFISAHGTATVFNDQMEAQAIHLAGLEDKPVHSLKGVFGHTLGAAGLLESIIGIEALKEDLILPSRGFSGNMLTPGLCISKECTVQPGMKTFIKTASGFGGCNAALLFAKCDATIN